MAKNSLKVKNGISIRPTDPTQQVSPEAGDIIVDQNDGKLKVYNSSDSEFSAVAKELVGDHNVMSFGADNTGATNCNQAILDCLSANGTVYLPEGTYLVSDLALTGGKLYGKGTIVREDGVGNHAIIMSGQNPVIEGLTFNSQTSATVNGDSEIKLGDSCRNPVIKNCSFLGGLYSAVSADANGEDDSSLIYETPAEGLDFSNNTVKGTYSRHLYLHSVENGKIINNDFQDSLYDCIRLRQGIRSMIISGNTFKNIGLEYSEDMPTEWDSGTSYSAGSTVGVRPYGVYEALSTTTIGSNPKDTPAEWQKTQDWYLNVVERPQNWISLDQYAVGDVVSVPPYGIYEAIATPTIGENPATTGVADWVNIAPAYFETRDIIDAYWSGKELIITDNIVDRCSQYGFDIKGVNPEGTYTSGRVIISNNILKDVYGCGINIHASELDAAGNFHYTGEYIIKGNYITECNRERFDISQSPITLRHGVRNVTISDNIIEKNYARGITVANLSETALISKGIIITNNQLHSNGIPGSPSNIGLNIGAVDGLTVTNNIVRNLDKVERYEVQFFTGVDGIYNVNETITFESKGGIAQPTIDVVDGDTSTDMAAKLFTALTSDDYLVPYEDNGSHYYDNVSIADLQSATADDPSGQMTITSLLDGANGNGVQVYFDADPTHNLYPQAGDFALVDGDLFVNIRTSTTPFHFLTSFVSNASAAIKAEFDFELKEGVDESAGNQNPVHSVDEQVGVTLAGGTNADKVYFDTRIEDALTGSVTGSVSGSGARHSFDVIKRETYSNSVSVYAASIQDYTELGTTEFLAPKLNYIIKDNFFDNNNDDPRYNVLFNYVEPPSLIAYVDSDNSTSQSIITPVAARNFIDGADAGVDNHINAQAYLIEQGITLKSRVAGAAGNNILFSIEQPATVDQILRVIIAPAVFGGNVIRLMLPTDSNGDPVDVTRADAEQMLRRRLAQGIMTYENNYLGNGYRPQPEVANFSSGAGESKITSTIANNQASTDVVGFDDLDPNTYTGYIINYHIQRSTDSQAVVETGTLNVSYNTNSSTWILTDVSGGQGSGVTFDMDVNSLQYASDDLTGTNYTGSIVLRINDKF